MRGADLKRLADVANLTRLDIVHRPIYLSWADGSCCATYRGTYVGAQLSVEDKDRTPGETLGLDANHLAAVSRQFVDDANVTVTVNRNAARIEGGGVSATLSAVVGPSEPAAFDLSLEGEATAEVPDSELLREALLAAEFTARSVAHRVLVGIRLAVGSNKVGMIASDGFSSILTTYATCRSDGTAQITVQPTDLLAALRLAELPVTLTVATGLNRVAVSSKSCRVVMSAVEGDWPNLLSVRQKVDTCERHTVALPSSALVSAIEVGKAMQGSPNVLIESSPTLDGVSIKTLAGEAGEFCVNVPVAATAGKVRAVYDTATMILASKLGSDLSFSIPTDSSIPTLVSAAQRRYLITQRYSPNA